MAGLGAAAGAWRWAGGARAGAWKRSGRNAGDSTTARGGLAVEGYRKEGALTASLSGPLEGLEPRHWRGDGENYQEPAPPSTLLEIPHQTSLPGSGSPIPGSFYHTPRDRWGHGRFGDSGISLAHPVSIHRRAGRDADGALRVASRPRLARATTVPSRSAFSTGAPRRSHPRVRARRSAISLSLKIQDDRCAAVSRNPAKRTSAGWIGTR